MDLSNGSIYNVVYNGSDSIELFFPTYWIELSSVLKNNIDKDNINKNNINKTIDATNLNLTKEEISKIFSLLRWRIDDDIYRIDLDVIPCEDKKMNNLKMNDFKIKMIKLFNLVFPDTELMTNESMESFVDLNSKIIRKLLGKELYYEDEHMSWPDILYMIDEKDISNLEDYLYFLSKGGSKQDITFSLLMGDPLLYYETLYRCKIDPKYKLICENINKFLLFIEQKDWNTVFLPSSNNVLSEGIMLLLYIVIGIDPIKIKIYNNSLKDDSNIYTLTNVEFTSNITIKEEKENHGGIKSIMTILNKSKNDIKIGIYLVYPVQYHIEAKLVRNK